MKRAICSLLALSLLLCGCAAPQDLEERVTFYYPLMEFRFGADQQSVIGSELREASGQRRNLSYLLALYLMGPLEDGLRTPVPAGTQILSVAVEGEEILLTLSDTSHSLSDADFTLACACLTLTCLELADVRQVTVTSGQRSAAMTRESLILFDRGPAAGTEETQ